MVMLEISMICQVLFFPFLFSIVVFMSWKSLCTSSPRLWSELCRDVPRQQCIAFQRSEIPLALKAKVNEWWALRCHCHILVFVVAIVFTLVL